MKDALGDIGPWAPVCSWALNCNGLHDTPLLELVPIEELGHLSHMATMILFVPAATLIFPSKWSFSAQVFIMHVGFSFLSHAFWYQTRHCNDVTA